MDELPTLFDTLEIAFDRDTELSVDAENADREKSAQLHADNALLDLPVEKMQRAEAIKFLSFGSGSSGNCAYLGCRGGGILIDAGVDNNQVAKGLADNGIDIATVAGIIITHDHNDHVRFAYSLLRRNPHMRLFCTPRALAGLLRRHNISRRISDYHQPIYKEFAFSAGGFTITPFEVSHDGSDNVGFHIVRNNAVFVVATDMGMISERAAYYTAQANYLMFESNYDATMLRTGKYPEYLKARIAGDRGHLDNIVAAQHVTSIASASPQLSHVFLCHLSADNNTPEKAIEAMRTTLQQAGISMGDASGSPQALAARLQVTPLPRYGTSPLFVLRRQ